MKRIVTIGGGTGSFTILSGLKRIPDIYITAVVSMADDGGSTGVLRDELGVLPPGDVRQCLVALSEHSDIVRRLMSYRFAEGGLAGHSFGNILLAALEKVTGNFSEGVEVASDILKVQGTVLPVTNDTATLLLELMDGTVLQGENAINHSDIQNIGIKKIYYASGVHINSRVKEELLAADIIILGPGNYYCSILPNLVVEGMQEVLQASQARIIFPVNLTNKKGHTDHWSVSTYVEDVQRYIGRNIDLVLINNRVPTDEQLAIYETQEGEGVFVADDLGKEINVTRQELLSHDNMPFQKSKADVIPAIRGFIRHDSDLFAKAVRALL